MTKRDNMKTKSDAELVKLLTDTREVLRTERFSAAGARAKESNAPRKHRVTIARVMTEQAARHTSAAASVSSDSRPTIA